MGVVRMYGWLVGVVVRRYIYRYPHNNYYFFLYTPLELALFMATASLFLCSFFNVFLFLFTVLALIIGMVKNNY